MVKHGKNWMDEHVLGGWILVWQLRSRDKVPPGPQAASLTKS